MIPTTIDSIVSTCLYQRTIVLLIILHYKTSSTIVLKVNLGDIDTQDAQPYAPEPVGQRACGGVQEECLPNFFNAIGLVVNKRCCGDARTPPIPSGFFLTSRTSATCFTCFTVLNEKTKQP